MEIFCRHSVHGERSVNRGTLRTEKSVFFSPFTPREIPRSARNDD
jgi:hypothetical protein